MTDNINFQLAISDLKSEMSEMNRSLDNTDRELYVLINQIAKLTDHNFDAVKASIIAMLAAFESLEKRDIQQNEYILKLEKRLEQLEVK